MKNENNETIEDIVRELRSEPLAECGAKPWLHYLADRIESAAKRERESGAETAQICGEIGEMVGREAACHQPVTDCHGLNAAKMRESLEQIANMGEQIDNQLGSSEETVYAFRNERCIAHNISECARAALDNPPRNCDLYTVGEALRRYGFPTKIKPWGEKEWLDFCEWCMSEAKGATDEQD